MALHVTIKVIPKSKHSKCVLDKNQTIKCYVQSVAEQGKANKELISLLAKKLKVSKSAIEITQGLSSRVKRIHIAIDLSFDEFIDRLGIERPMSLFT